MKHFANDELSNQLILEFAELRSKRINDESNKPIDSTFVTKKNSKIPKEIVLKALVFKWTMKSNFFEYELKSNIIHNIFSTSEIKQTKEMSLLGKLKEYQNLLAVNILK